MQKSYYAIIPADVRYDNSLTANSKLLYGEITALCNEKGFCWATNSYFAELYSVSNTSVSKWIKQLIECGYLKSQLIYKEGSKEILHRYLSLVKEGTQEKLNTPIQEKLKDNTTVINTTINIYGEKDFLEDWSKCRKAYLNLPTHISKLEIFEALNFKKATNIFTREQIQSAMKGLFLQEIISFSSMTTKPNHFLERVEQYYMAYESKDFKQYGSKKAQE